MLALVTGAAGFIGSTLTDRLLEIGWDVRGVDRFTAYYDVETKRKNLADALGSQRFQLVQGDLLDANLDSLLEDVEVVFHLAGQPGVRLSWAEGFREYSEANINATQRLLEAARSLELKRFVYASSSSVYGETRSVPTEESHPTHPHSPYGVTKLAGEHLCHAYGRNHGVPTTSLRYFTVYGPRQRPDMAIHRMIEAAIEGRTFTLFGDGEQIRDFTFVDDIVRATIAAGETELESGTVCNVAGGSSITVNKLIDIVAHATETDFTVQRAPAQAGDVRQTGGSTQLAQKLLDWRPLTALDEGVRQQAMWHMAQRQ